jgi:hypothetical protein
MVTPNGTTLQPGRHGNLRRRQEDRAGESGPGDVCAALRLRLSAEGFAPKLLKDTVVRGGYGINYNTGQYACSRSRSRTRSRSRDAEQRPNHAEPQQAARRTTRTTTANMTLANGFGCSTGRDHHQQLCGGPELSPGHGADLQPEYPEDASATDRVEPGLQRIQGSRPRCLRNAEWNIGGFFDCGCGAVRLRGVGCGLALQPVSSKPAEAAAEGYLAGRDLHLQPHDRQCIVGGRRRSHAGAELLQPGAGRGQRELSTSGTT